MKVVVATRGDAAALAEAGAAQESYQQALINADVERWNTEQLGPISALNLYNQLVQGNYGSTVTTSTSQDSGGSKLGGVISGVSSGASMGATVGGPWGALIGGLGGGILSFL